VVVAGRVVPDARHLRVGVWAIASPVQTRQIARYVVGGGSMIPMWTAGLRATLWMRWVGFVSSFSALAFALAEASMMMVR
jgi:hypothetical protein